MSKRVHLDYEGRSGVDITEVGSHRWSIDPQFEIFMAGVSADAPDSPVFLWINPLFRTPDEMGDNEIVEQMLGEADEIWAHNAPNEVANTWGALEQNKACPFPAMPGLDKFRCTAAMARKAGLPFSLEKVSDALQLGGDGKNREGKALIQFFCIIDEETGQFRDPRDHPEKWNKFCDYCRQDVRAERLVGHKLKPFELSGAALATFQFDMRMNQRGIPINVTAARNAQLVIDETQSGVVQEFRKLTGLNPTQGKKFRPWLKDNLGVDLPNLQGATVEAEIQRRIELAVSEGEAGKIGAPKDIKALEVLLMYQKVSYAAVKKISTMLDCLCPDGFIRGMFMYYGAGTGRWSAQKLQPHNFKKTPAWMRTKEDDITDAVYQAFCDGMKAEHIEQLYGEPLEVLSGVIRNFIHLPGVEMLDGDYSGVEARIIAWLAGQEDVIQEWKDYDAKLGPGPYVHMAAYIYGMPVSEVTADQREVGKRVILGAGFQMGWRRFIKSCLDLYQLVVPKDIAKKGIKLFRKKCGKIRDYWWMLNNSAINTIETGVSTGPFSVRKVAGIPYLLFRLRSGRSLAYPYPEVNLVKWVPEPDDEEDEFGEPIIPAKKKEPQWRKEITYWGQIPLSGQWGRIKLYGGKLAENETQATAADFMSNGSIVAESRSMAPFMLVHDQGLALRTGNQSARDYEDALGTLPDWAKGFPMKVEAKIARYYKK